MPTRSENCISALAEILVAFFGAGASAAAFFAPFFAMLIDRVFGSQGTCKVRLKILLEPDACVQAYNSPARLLQKHIRNTPTLSPSGSSKDVAKLP